MNRSDALERWRRIARGDLRRDQYDPIDLHAWIEDIAVAVIKADEQPNSSQRPYDLTKAIGLKDKGERWPALRQALEIWSSFDPPEAWGRGDRRRALISVAMSVHPEWHGLTDEQVLKRAEQILVKLKRP